MAKWQVYTASDGRVGLLYVNTATGQSQCCGRLDAPVSQREFIEWIVQKGEPAPGDLITFEDGTVLAIAYREAKA